MNIGKIIKICTGLFVTTLVYMPYLIGIFDTNAISSQVQQAGEIPEPAGIILITFGGLLLHRRHQKRSK